MNAYNMPQAPRMGTIPLPLPTGTGYVTPPVTPRHLPVPVPVSPAHRGGYPVPQGYPSPASPGQLRPLPPAAPAPVAVLNPHLQCHSVPACVWDVRQSPAHAQNAHRQLIDHRMPATVPALPEITLVLDVSPAPAPIRVVASDRRAVTVGDVLNAIYSVLVSPINPVLASQISQPKRQRMAGGDRVMHLLERSLRFTGLRPYGPSAPYTFQVTFGIAQ